jgi:hypothetical protein
LSWALPKRLSSAALEGLLSTSHPLYDNEAFGTWVAAINGMAYLKELVIEVGKYNAGDNNRNK